MRVLALSIFLLSAAVPDAQAETWVEVGGTVEIDCALRVNRIRRIDMLDEQGAVVWSSGDMPRQLWLSVKPNSHAESTLDVACAYHDRI